MTMIDVDEPTRPPDADIDLEAALVQRAAACGPLLAEHAAVHDRDGSWVHESFAHVRDSGLLAIGVPVELGGAGATIRQVAMVQRELAQHCASTALAHRCTST